MGETRTLPAEGRLPWQGADRAPLQHRAGWVLLAVVTLAHVLAANELAADRFGWGSGAKPMSRIEVAFVRELAQAKPPEPPADARRPVPTPQSSLPAVAAASAPAKADRSTVEPDASPGRPLAVAVPVDLPPSTAATSESAPDLAPVTPPNALAQAAGQTPALTAPAAASAAAPMAIVAPTPPMALPVPVNAAEASNFDWPPSTRMSYRLSGYFRGPIEGRAQVDWLRSGTRYQVHLQTDVGPLLSRRISSEGELTDRGLAPQRFEGEQKVVFRAPRRWTQQFGPERIVLADGREVATLPGAQDEASQFVQLTWLFTTQPQLLQVGGSMEVPLAVNRSFNRWIYDVVDQQTLRLPFGEVETFHVKPRRELKGGDLTAEIWFAPSLQYLPVRILIRQDEATFVDLLLDKPPLQAGR